MNEKELHDALLQIVDDYENSGRHQVTQASINQAKRALGLPLSYSKPCPICGRCDGNHLYDMKHLLITGWTK